MGGVTVSQSACWAVGAIHHGAVVKQQIRNHWGSPRTTVTTKVAPPLSTHTHSDTHTPKPHIRKHSFNPERCSARLVPDFWDKRESARGKHLQGRTESSPTSHLLNFSPSIHTPTSPVLHHCCLTGSNTICGLIKSAARVCDVNCGALGPVMPHIMLQGCKESTYNKKSSPRPSRGATSQGSEEVLYHLSCFF